MKRIRILLADDHAVVRHGFRMILEAQPDMEIAGEAGNGREAVRLAEELKPDIVVMDVAMPELNGIEATRRLAAALPHTRVVALSRHKDAVYVRETLRSGAKGCGANWSRSTPRLFPSKAAARASSVTNSTTSWCVVSASSRRQPSQSSLPTTTP